MRDFGDVLAEVEARIAAACARSGRDRGEVEIVAVTKTHGAEVVGEAWEHGLRIVGENRVQEAAWKRPASVSGPDWHLIGHLQTNKVRPALALFDFFHSVDTVQLLDRMERIAAEDGRRPHVLLEVNVSGERSKSGMRPDEVPHVLEHAFAACPSITVEGFMTMAPFVPPEKVEQTRPFFRRLRELRDEMEAKFAAGLPRLSMGMSGDFEVAVEEGATWVRLGTVLFGERPKNRIARVADDDGLPGGGLDSYSGAGETVKVLD